VSLWWLKKPNLRIALAAIAVQWIFVVVFVAVGFDVHTHPSKDEYYAIPTRVNDPRIVFLDNRILKYLIVLVLVG
jgi:hypothetical protein